MLPIKPKKERHQPRLPEYYQQGTYEAHYPPSDNLPVNNQPFPVPQEYFPFVSYASEWQESELYPLQWQAEQMDLERRHFQENTTEEGALSEHYEQSEDLKEEVPDYTSQQKSIISNAIVGGMENLFLGASGNDSFVENMGESLIRGAGGVLMEHLGKTMMSKLLSKKKKKPSTREEESDSSTSSSETESASSDSSSGLW